MQKLRFWNEIAFMLLVSHMVVVASLKGDAKTYSNIDAGCPCCIFPKVIGDIEPNHYSKVSPEAIQPWPLVSHSISLQKGYHVKSLDQNPIVLPKM